MILETILGHKAAAAGAALLLGTTTAVAATGNVPFVRDEEPAVVVEDSQPVDGTDDPTESTTTTEATSTTSSTSTTELQPDTGQDSGDVEEKPAVGEGADADEVLPPTDEDGVPFGLVDCYDAATHGEYVSGVARDPRIDGNRGEIVSQAARTSCGKNRSTPTAAAETDEPESDDADEVRDVDSDVDEQERDASEAERSSRRDGSKGNSGNGNGHRGNGNGGGKKDR